MSLQESGEMYLETIYVLSQKSPYVRGVDVGEAMGYSKPSVSRAVGLLKKDGLVRTDEAGFIRLTEAGEEKAKQIYERHVVFTKLLMNLGVDEKTAAEDACRIEHYISDTSFEAIKAHMNQSRSPRVPLQRRRPTIRGCPALPPRSPQRSR
ncbi:MAG: metal-dependent transcriptional regulator [Oscillospiraceae bacterium]|nr:metal-dependent transcriptional regulator [Oscillospiraceae bacterium]